MLKILLVFGLLLLFLYLLGPRPPRPSLGTHLPPVPSDLARLQQEIDSAEGDVPNLKPDNQSRIIWANPARPGKTAYSLVYLPGFTATHAEGDPIHREFARRYGCNLYLPRLHGHGLDDVDVFATLTADEMVASAAHALAVGKQLGEQVILMSMSTGSTLSLILAADHPDIAALLTYSPNIRLKEPSARLLDNPWGLHLVRLVKGGRYYTYDETEEYKKYWYTRYRLEGLVALQSLLENSMHRGTFTRVRQPFFMGYYYKNETEQDQVVSVPAMLAMYDQLGTPEALKRKIPFPDVGKHALLSYITSEDLDSVRRETFRFAEEVLGLAPLNH